MLRLPADNNSSQKVNYKCQINLDPDLASVYMCLVFTCWERAAFLALMYVMYSSVLVTDPYGILGQVRYLIVSILDLCLLTYFSSSSLLGSLHLDYLP